MILTFVGTAGSGKTTLTQAFGKYLEENDYRVSYVNLDTGVKRLPYRPDLDDIEYLTARLRLEPVHAGAPRLQNVLDPSGTGSPDEGSLHLRPDGRGIR